MRRMIPSKIPAFIHGFIRGYENPRSSPASSTGYDIGSRYTAPLVTGMLANTALAFGVATTVAYLNATINHKIVPEVKQEMLAPGAAQPSFLEISVRSTPVKGHELAVTYRGQCFFLRETQQHQPYLTPCDAGPNRKANLVERSGTQK